MEANKKKENKVAFSMQININNSFNFSIKSIN